MKHRKKYILALTAVATMVCNLCQAQVVNNTFGQYWLEPHNPPESFTVGNTLHSGFSLEVRGDEMTGFPTGNVFKTDAPGDQDTYWRMFQGSKEYGTLFHVDNTQNLDLDAVVGHLRFHANDSLRMQLNTSQLVNFGPDFLV
jgi:hypothetical protein